jgi:hypothetical protein
MRSFGIGRKSAFAATLKTWRAGPRPSRSAGIKLCQIDLVFTANRPWRVPGPQSGFGRPFAAWGANTARSGGWLVPQTTHAAGGQCACLRHYGHDATRPGKWQSWDGQLPARAPPAILQPPTGCVSLSLPSGKGHRGLGSITRWLEVARNKRQPVTVSCDVYASEKREAFQNRSCS